MHVRLDSAGERGAQKLHTFKLAFALGSPLPVVVARTCLARESAAPKLSDSANGTMKKAVNIGFVGSNPPVTDLEYRQLLAGHGTGVHACTGSVAMHS